LGTPLTARHDHGLGRPLAAEVAAIGVELDDGYPPDRDRHVTPRVALAAAHSPPKLHDDAALSLSRSINQTDLYGRIVIFIAIPLRVSDSAADGVKFLKIVL
jgi:hypothetical protein